LVVRENGALRRRTTGTRKKKGDLKRATRGGFKSLARKSLKGNPGRVRIRFVTTEQQTSKDRAKRGGRPGAHLCVTVLRSSSGTAGDRTAKKEEKRTTVHRFPKGPETAIGGARGEREGEQKVRQGAQFS